MCCRAAKVRKFFLLRIEFIEGGGVYVVARFHRLVFLLVAWEGLVGFDVEGFVGEEVEHEGAGLGLDALHA